MSTIYQQACDIRHRAEKTTDPEAYEQAGRAFDLLGMPAAAGRMYDRAEYYRSNVPEPMEPDHARAR